MTKATKRAGHEVLFPVSFWKMALFLAMVMVCAQVNIAFSDETFRVDPVTLKEATDKWGKEAQVRLLAWEHLIVSDRSVTDREKLEKVNAFMNKIPYGEDIDIWGLADYWATPVEFIGRGAGDCEDYAIAKYFTLRTMGVPDQKLRITYVKAMQLNRTHMVLTYVNHPGEEPLVLDNLDKSIKPASERRDLIPIFSFNGTELWMAQTRGQGESIQSNRLKPWRNLLKRMSDQKS
jgi:predicted transglutaminase-like cysteine proteinase